MSIKIGYNKLIVSLPVALAVLIAVLSFLAEQKGYKTTGETWFIVIALLVLSLPMYFLPYIVVRENEIWVNNQFGMPRRKAKFKSQNDIKFEHGNIMVHADDYDRKLHYSKILVDGKALLKFKKMLEEKREKLEG